MRGLGSFVIARATRGPVASALCGLVTSARATRGVVVVVSARAMRGSASTGVQPPTSSGRCASTAGAFFTTCRHCPSSVTTWCCPHCADG